MSIVALLLLVVGGLLWRMSSTATEAGDLRAEVRSLEQRLGAVEARLADMDEVVRPATVPDVVGLRLDEAERRLVSAGLTPSVTEGDPSQPDARVIAQEPPDGMAVGAGATVGLRTRTP